MHFVSRWKIESSKASVSFGGTLHQTKVPAVFVVVKDDSTWPHESTLGVVVRMQHIVLDIVSFAPLCGETAIGCVAWVSPSGVVSMYAPQFLVGFGNSNNVGSWPVPVNYEHLSQDLRACLKRHVVSSGTSYEETRGHPIVPV